MNTEQLDGILSRIIVPPTKFLGVFAKDQIPDTRSLTHYPSCFVANTDPSTKPGEHWVAIWIESPESCEFFYSYGIAPNCYGFVISCTTVNPKPIQSLNSVVCGYYCIYFLYCRSRGLSLTQIQNSFSFSNSEWNDFQVSRFVHKHFGIYNPASRHFLVTNLAGHELDVLAFLSLRLSLHFCCYFLLFTKK